MKARHSLISVLSIFVLFLSVFLVNTSKSTISPSQAEEADVEPTFKVNDPDKIEYTGDVIVKYRGESGANLFSKYSTEPIDEERKIVKVVSTVENVDALVASFSKNPDVEYAEADFYVYYTQATVNDPLFNKQWWLMKIQAPQAWAINKGSANVTLGIIDTGASREHPDLKNKIKMYGGSPECANARGAHGTHTTGIMAAGTNNAIGGASIGNQLSIAVYGLGGCNGMVPVSKIPPAIRWLVDTAKVKVINMSLGTSGMSDSFKEAINYAHSKDVIVVAAAGNTGKTKVEYPAGFPGVIGVAATDSGDRLARFSTRGGWVKVAAPGVSVLSTVQGGGYQAWDGTSMASPVVAGLVGLMRSAFPNLNRQQIIDKLCSTSDKIPGTGSNFQCGRVNAAKALAGGSSGIATPVPSGSSTPGSGNATILLSFQGINRKSGDVETVINREKIKMVSDENGIYRGSIKVSRTGSYDLLIKTDSHLQKRFKNLYISSGKTIDLSGKQVYELKAGDVNNDNRININDVSQVSTYYTTFAVKVDSTPKMKASDVNKDGFITIQDLALISINWSDIEVLGDQ